SVVTKLEYGFAAAGLGAAFLAGRGLVAETRSRWGRDALALMAPALAAAGGVAAVVLAQMPLTTVLESVWPLKLMRVWNSGGAWRGDLGTWTINLKLIAAELALLAAIAGHAELL